VTSHDIVGMVRRLFSTRAVGHAGTLDPMATGVLVVLIGRAAKASEYLTEADKHYVAVMRLGVTTDTEDVTGRVLSESNDIPSSDRVFRAVKNFVGEIEQTPPMYSAVRVGGKRLMELAREGKVIDRPSRRITVYSIEPIALSDREYSLDVVCSKGTYIRTLCADIGRALGCGAVMSALCRTETCGFDLSMAHTPEELEAMSEAELDAAILPLSEIFSHYPAYSPAPFFVHLTKNGLSVELRKLASLPCKGEGERLRLFDEAGAFYALAEITCREERLVLTPLKQF
jgi:tRNA pseudouridine55 synthase